MAPLRRAILEVKQPWSVIGWVTKNLLFPAPPSFARHIKPLDPAAVVSTPINLHWAGVVGYGLFSLCVIHKEGLCPSSGDINRLMMMMIHTYHSRFIPERVAEASQIFRRDAPVLPKLFSYE
jgi:hypothetical protein